MKLLGAQTTITLAMVLVIQSVPATSQGTGIFEGNARLDREPAQFLSDLSDCLVNSRDSGILSTSQIPTLQLFEQQRYDWIEIYQGVNIFSNGTAVYENRPNTVEQMLLLNDEEPLDGINTDDFVSSFLDYKNSDFGAQSANVPSDALTLNDRTFSYNPLNRDMYLDGVKINFSTESAPLFRPEILFSTSPCDQYLPTETLPEQFKLPGALNGCPTCASTDPKIIVAGIEQNLFPNLSAQTIQQMQEYASSPKGEACSSAFFDSTRLPVPEIVTNEWLETIKNAKRRVSAYLSNCLRVENGGDFKIGEEIDDFTSERILFNQIIIFEISGRCHGLINQSPEGNLYLITARHCLAENKQRTTYEFPESFTSRTLVGTELNLEICEDEKLDQELATRTPYNDRVKLMLCKVSDNAGRQVDRFASIEESQDISIGDRLMIASQIIYFTPILIDFREKLGEYENFDNPFAVDDTATCRIFDRLDELLLHNCQTEIGTSGAPVFKINQTNSGKTWYSLVAIHTGFSGNLEGYGNSEFVRNRALKLDPN